jgi:hypothetical protein
MADPYLELLEEAFRAGAKDLHQAAKLMDLPFETVCNTFNNGLLKGYWSISINKGN